MGVVDEADHQKVVDELAALRSEYSATHKALDAASKDVKRAQEAQAAAEEKAAIADAVKADRDSLAAALKESQSNVEALGAELAAVKKKADAAQAIADGLAVLAG